ncbi:hypothetical protein I3760_12G094200 [Carya illinoinensis]|nr:hypothetical protein I3760_12G094200 [Carya illinoinensis]
MISPSKNLSINSYYLYITLCFALTHGARFVITNNCSYTVWAAAIPGGGMELNPGGGTWTIDHFPASAAQRNLNRVGAYSISQESSHPLIGILGFALCGVGGPLQCQAYGAPPNTLAEYALNQFNNLDFFDIPLVDGFNVPMEFSPTFNGCTHGIRCTADINGQCPNELKAPGGCNNPCTIFKTDQYCCNSGSCRPTNYSKFFKTRCPDAYSYPDDQNGTFTCNGGTNYKVTFCP